MDFITPLPKTARGNAGMFVVMDRLSKLIRIAATPATVDAPEVARLFHTHVYREHGLPLEIISDRDPIFMSKFWTTLFGMLRVKLRPSSAYHPETDGQTEVVNRKVEEILRCFVDNNQSNWDLFLVDLEFAYNSAPNSSTTLSPFYLTYGIEPRGTLFGMAHTSNSAATDFIQNIHVAVNHAHDAIIRANDHTTIQANRHGRPSNFPIGDLVFLSTRNIVSHTYTGARKLMPKFCGPFAIKTRINDVTYRLDLSAPMLARGIHNAFHANFSAPTILIHSSNVLQWFPRPNNSPTATPNMRWTTSFVSASIAASPSIWSIEKVMMITKTLGSPPQI
jgi:hypothetical protein